IRAGQELARPGGRHGGREGGGRAVYPDHGLVSRVDRVVKFHDTARRNLGLSCPKSGPEEVPTWLFSNNLSRPKPLRMAFTTPMSITTNPRTLSPVTSSPR